MAAYESKIEMMANFVAQHDVVTCSGCSKLLGFEHKKSKNAFCLNACHAHSQLTGIFGISNDSIVMQTNVCTEKTCIEEKKHEEELKPAKVQGVQAKTKIFITDLEFSENLFSPNAEVILLKIYDPKTYVMMAKRDEAAVADMEVLLKYSAESTENLQEPPIKDQVVLSKIDDKYQRGLVRAVEDEWCYIRHIDYGHLKKCRFDELKYPNEAVLKFPIFALAIQLFDVPKSPAEFFLEEKQEKEILSTNYHLKWINRTKPESTGKLLQGKVQLVNSQNEDLGESIRNFYCTQVK